MYMQAKVCVDVNPSGDFGYNGKLFRYGSLCPSPRRRKCPGSVYAVGLIEWAHPFIKCNLISEQRIIQYEILPADVEHVLIQYAPWCILLVVHVNSFLTHTSPTLT